MYFKLLKDMPSIEILMHRIVWSAAILLGLAWAMNQWFKIKRALTTTRVLLILLISGLLLAFNWFLFIWAVNSDLILDASLAYYINPLLNVLLGRLFLGERLRTLQKVAVLLALFGVAILVISFGQIPWIALMMAISFGVYGLLRKTVDVDALPGLLIETLLMLPFAIFYWLAFATQSSNLLTNTQAENLIIICAGIVTTAPLLCFTGAAKRITLSALGFFQYIGPSIMFVLAVFVYGEAFEPARAITFAFVWTALVIFSVDSLRQYQLARRTAKSMSA